MPTAETTQQVCPELREVARRARPVLGDGDVGDGHRLALGLSRMHAQRAVLFSHRCGLLLKYELVVSVCITV